MSIQLDIFGDKFTLMLKGKSSYKVDVGADGLGNITRINNALESIPSNLQTAEERLETLHQQMETAKAELQKPFTHGEELKSLENRLSELNALLNMDSGGDRPDEESREGEPESKVEKLGVDERISADKPTSRA
jgi:hypothetical protein